MRQLCSSHRLDVYRVHLVVIHRPHLFLLFLLSKVALKRELNQLDKCHEADASEEPEPAAGVGYNE